MELTRPLRPSHRWLGLCLLLLVAQETWPAFEPVQPDVFGVGGTLVNAVADYDGDGDLDLFVGFNGAGNRLYRNDGGVFTDVAAAAGLADTRATRAAAWGDMDGDGDADLLVGFAPSADARSVLRLYRNNGGTFTDVTLEAGLTVDSAAVRQPVWIDVDEDGDLDLFIAFRDRPNALYRNEGPGAPFRDVAYRVGLADPRRSVGAVWFDYDEDGDQDLYVANMDGDPNALYRNEGGGERFTDVARATGLAWGGRAPEEPDNGTVRPCVGDVDNDGHLDLIMANYGPGGLFLNRGGGRFADVSAAWGVAIDSRYDTCVLGDVDHDGRIDLYLNGTVTGGVSYRDYLFQNDRDRFADRTPPNIEALHADHGAALADLDGDGDLDLALTGARPEGMHAVMRNMVVPGRGLTLRLVRPGGLDPVPGTELRYYDPEGRVLGTRIVDTGSGYNAQSLVPIHIGVRQGLSRIRIEVVVPQGGRRTVVAREELAVDGGGRPARTIPLP